VNLTAVPGVNRCSQRCLSHGISGVETRVTGSGPDGPGDLQSQASIWITPAPRYGFCAGFIYPTIGRIHR
ncbi:MAG: hypothetical protein ACREV1_18915, partial [Gammaproteobacteria bacterium]